MYNATLSARFDQTDTLSIIQVKPDSGVVDFLPGQYIALGLSAEFARPEVFGHEEITPPVSGLIKRSYSVGSSPEEKNFYEFYIAILPQGQLTARLAGLKAGDRLFIGRKPIGTFTAEPIPPGSNIYAFSTGTGIAPFMSMLRTPNILSKVNSFTLLHGVRYDTDFGYSSELHELIKNNSKISYYPIVSRDSKDWSGARGYVQDFIKKEIIVPNPTTDHIMLCGNPAMIEDLEKILLPRGFIEHSKKTPGNLHVEKYW